LTTYLNSEDYNALVEELLAGSADPLDRKNAIRMTLGERVDVWPEEIKDDVENDVIEEGGAEVKSTAIEALKRYSGQ
jgi:hypothetical protein